MSDMKIEVDASDVNTAKAALGDYAATWASMVAKIVAEENKLARAVKASSDQQMSAIDQALAVVEQKRAAAWASGAARQIQLMENTKKATQRAADAEAKAVLDAAKENERAVNDWATAARRKIQLIENTKNAVERAAQAEKALTDQATAKWVQQTNQRIALMQRVQQEQDKAAAAAAKEAQQLDNLRAQYDSGFAAVQKYNSVKRDLSRLLETGRMDLAQYEAQLESLTQQFVAFQNGTAQAGNMFGYMHTNASDAQKRMQAFGADAQNVGYQVADMAVQIQGGTHWMVALGQQGSQTLAIFGMWGAIAGAVLAVGAALGTAYFGMNKAKGEAEELTDTLENLGDLEPLFESVGRSLEDSLSGSIQRIRAEYGNFVADVAQSRIDLVKSNLQGSIAGLGNEGSSRVGSSLWAGFAGVIPGMAGGVTSYEDRVLGAQTESILSGALMGEDTIEGMAEAFARAYDQIAQLPGVTEEWLAKVEAIGVAQGINNVLQEREAAERERVTGILERYSDFVTQNREDQEKTNTAHAETLRSMQQEAILAELSAKFGENSLNVIQARQRFERANLIAKAEQLGYSDAQLQAEMSLLEQQQRYQQATELGVNTWGSILNLVENLSGVDIETPVWGAVSAADAFYYRMLDVLGTINGILGAIGQIGFDTIALEAENAALAAGANAAEANVAGQNAQFGARMDAAFGDSVLGNLAAGLATRAHEIAQEDRLAAQNTNDGLMDDLRERERAARGSGRKGGGRKGRDEKTAEDILAEYEAEIQQRERLIGVSEEQREILEYVAEIEDKLGDKREEVTDERIMQLAMERDRIEEAIRAQEEAEQAQQRLNDALTGNFKDAVMSVVEGTESVKDAFRNMLRSMILDIYEQMVLEKYTKSAVSFLGAMFSANGNAFGPSGHISYFAKGDVFNSPTAFQFGGGRLGVMGEAGPEAVMPLKRGADGKLGVASSGVNGSVVIEQHFHISANGDESVRKIIRQESPKIAEQAKNAVLKAKVQGGSYSNAFKK